MRGSVAAVLLITASATAAPRTLSVAAGSCRDTDLVQAQAAFSDLLRGRLAADAVDSRALLASVRPAPALGLDALQRGVEAAQSRFYAGQHDAALAQAKEAIEGLEQTTPSVKSWKLLATARVLQGMVLKATKKNVDAAEAFRRVLRVVPNHLLDANEYSPSTIAAFEAARKELKGTKRFPVSVASQPPGAEVFLDGAPVGKTPFTGALPAGSYSLSILGDGGASFPRTLRADGSAEVDLAFEASVAPQLPLCVEGSADEATARAVKLGAFARADQLVLLRLAPREGQPDWLEAALFDVVKGTKVRAGGMRLVASRQTGSLDALVSWVLTGEGKGVVSSDAAALSGTPTRPPAPVVEHLPPPAPAAVAVEAPARGSGPRIAGLAIAGAGVATGIASIVVYAAGSQERELLIALLDPQGRLPPEGAQGRDEALALQPRVDGNTAATVALSVTGGVLAIGGGILAVVLPPDAPRVSAAVTPNGAAVGLTGSF